jgi:hypothetical protein
MAMSIDIAAISLRYIMLCPSGKTFHVCASVHVVYLCIIFIAIASFRYGIMEEENLTAK